MKEVQEEELVTKGRMTRSPFEMTLAEEKQWQIQQQLEVKRRLFAIGQPFVYEKDGKTIAEYADGSSKVIR